MTAWKYTINGTTLRELTKVYESKENCAKCIIELRRLTKKCFDMLKDEDYTKDDFEDLYYLLDGDDEICLMEYNEMLEYGWRYATELVNERLEEFYNLCDAERIWIK